MLDSWDTYSRQGVDLATSATSLGFSVVKSTTKLGFAITRGIANTAADLTAAVVDYTLFGGSTVARPVIGGAVSSVLSLAEQITLAPIFLGEYITHTSLIAAHSSINVLSVIFPGSSEASFSLASFITLVKREWGQPAPGQVMPAKQYGLTQVARAIVAWVFLQRVTQEWQEKRWMQHVREIYVKEHSKMPDLRRSRRGSRVRVTSDVIFPGNRGQIIAADIGDAPRLRSQSFISSLSSLSRLSTVSSKQAPPPAEVPKMSNTELKATLRRLSKMVLAGYGGASLLFFGVSPTIASPSSSAQSRTERASEEAQLANAVDASEAEAAGGLPEAGPAASEYSWWDVLLGRHDQEIFERFANTPPEQAQAEINAKLRATAVVGIEHQMPRFWVLTDHSRGQIVLVLRGTMSLNEIAVDLTCDAEDFDPATTAGTASYPGQADEPPSPVPGEYTFNTRRPLRRNPSSFTSPRYHVHSGMLRMARAMGEVGKPVQLAVHEALYRNPDYELVLCGHSLGAGVAAILGMMWADPRTCLTVRSSGLPVGRKVSVYCFGPPCLTDAALSRLASKMVVSFVYSHDIVSRLSLGHVRDLKNAAMWLCDAHEATEGKNAGSGYAAVTSRAKMWIAGHGSADDANWFIAVRKTLEANMHMTTMYPPGRVLWAMRDSDLLPAHQLPAAEKAADGRDKLRLFEVLDAERVFSQIIFAKDMLSAHLPHQYDRVLMDLL